MGVVTLILQKKFKAKQPLLQRAAGYTVSSYPSMSRLVLANYDDYGENGPTDINEIARQTIPKIQAYLVCGLLGSQSMTVFGRG